MTDPNERIEYVASRIWYAYCLRVSGQKWADKSPWSDVDAQTSRIFLCHAVAAIAAINDDNAKKEMSLMSELEAFRAASDAKSEKLSKALRKPVTIRGVTYNGAQAAADALGVSISTVKSAKASGRLDTVGKGKGSNLTKAQIAENSEKRRKRIDLDGAVFHGWKEAVHITGLSRQTILKRGAKVSKP